MRLLPRNLKLVVVIGINLFLSFLFIYVLDISRKKIDATSETAEDNPTTMIYFNSRVELSKNELPLCTGNLLDQREYSYTKDKKESHNGSTLLISQSGSSCKLRHYTDELAVKCLDNLYHAHFTLNRPTYPKFTRNPANILNEILNKELYFVFMGDSRIRQQFYNFLKLIPNYDKRSEPEVIPSAFHGDIDVTSKILRLRVSFLWRPVINETVLQKISQWAIYDPSERPCLILLSMAVHHMVPISDGDQYKVFQKWLIELGPTLGRLANISRVIWLNQYPTLDFYGERPRNYNIYSEKIHHYNEAIRLILENYKQIRIWDSSNTLGEEYVRACTILKRDWKFSPNKVVKDYATAYVNCYDYVHTGYSALSEATQFLYNHICNTLESRFSW